MSEPSSLVHPDGEGDSGDWVVWSGNLQIRNKQAATRPCDFDPVVDRLLTKRFTVKIRPGTKRMTLLRFLMAKLVYGTEVEGLSVEEYLVLYELYFEAMDSSDPNLRAKWDNSLEKVKNLFIALARITEFPVVLSEESRNRIRITLKEDPLLPSPSAYYGLLGNRQLRSSFVIQFDSPWIPRKRIERYIGVGYKDKGNRRLPELDGSPSWQRVATVLSYHEAEVEEAEAAYSSSPEQE